MLRAHHGSFRASLLFSTGTVTSAVTVMTALFVTGCSPHPDPAPAARAPAGAAASAAPARTGAVFELHSDPWSSLHERLLAEATSDKFWHTTVDTCPCARAPDGSVLPAWAAAVAQYKKTFHERNYFADSPLLETRLVLALAGDDAGVPPRVDKDLSPHLGNAFPLYATRWPTDDARNRAWIATVEPLLRRWAPEIAVEMSKRLETTWPTRPIRVEVTQYAGFAGAYTTNDSAILTTMSSEDRGYAAPAALEMLFHEAAHGLTSVLDHDLQMAFIAKGRRPPPSLDHAIIFYTAGEVVRRRLGPSYRPYAYRQGVYERGWQKLEIAMRAHWQKWLDDEIDLPTALSRLADAFVE